MEVQTSSLVSSVRGGTALSNNKPQSSDKSTTSNASAAVEVAVDLSQVVNKIAIKQSTDQPVIEDNETVAEYRKASNNVETVIYSSQAPAQQDQNVTSAALGNSTDLTI